MVVITPYGWYTWVFGAAAIFLPYIAVVTANVSQNVRPTAPESPERALPAAPARGRADPRHRAPCASRRRRAVEDGGTPDEQA